MAKDQNSPVLSVEQQMRLEVTKVLIAANSRNTITTDKNAQIIIDLTNKIVDGIK